jgi:hypothetical protein
MAAAPFIQDRAALGRSTRRGLHTPEGVAEAKAEQVELIALANKSMRLLEILTALEAAAGSEDFGLSTVVMRIFTTMPTHFDKKGSTWYRIPTTHSNGRIAFPLKQKTNSFVAVVIERLEHRGNRHKLNANEDDSSSTNNRRDQFEGIVYVRMWPHKLELPKQDRRGRLKIEEEKHKGSVVLAIEMRDIAFMFPAIYTMVTGKEYTYNQNTRGDTGNNWRKPIRFDAGVLGKAAQWAIERRLYTSDNAKKEDRKSVV